MKKIAFFVEGLTEQVFLEKLLIEIFGAKNIAIEIKKRTGGSSVAPKITILSSPSNVDTAKYYALIVDCNGEGSVKSYILDNRETLVKANYTKIIGLLDVYPNFQRDEVNKYKRGLYYGVPQKELRIDFILSIMELESWFLAEYTHFCKIDQNLTTKLISDSLGFNPEVDDMEYRAEPATDLNDCYHLVGKSYVKDKKRINRTVDALDYAKVYMDTLTRVSSLNDFITAIEEIFK